ncbi:MAG: 30S ribosomal protein S6 [Clostridiales bacterium]|jgi:small subunit ribosomal protein S6|nr:30S ribosomal protein S6 [Clostridiales bacterium]
MHKYELAVVLSPTLEDDARQAEFEVVTGMIEKFGGAIEKVDDWGKRRLAYEIKKVTEGYYSFVKFSAPPETAAEIESRIRLRENVLRYLIVREDE